MERWDYFVLNNGKNISYNGCSANHQPGDLNGYAQHELGLDMGWVIINPLQLEEQEVEEVEAM